MPTAKEIQRWLIEQISSLSKIPVDKVDIKTPFINYGLESVELIGISGDLESWLHYRLEPNLLYDYPTIEQLANYLENVSQAKMDLKEKTPLTKVASTQTFFPLSYRQEWLFLHSHFGLNILFAIHVKERLNIQAFKLAINEIIKRHDNLRAGLTLLNQKPMQFIASVNELEIPLIKLNDSKHENDNVVATAEKIALEMLQEELDLSKPPLMRTVIVEKNKDEYILLFLFHHLIFDGFSVWVFLHELKILYESFMQGTQPTLPPLPFQYADYIDWQRKTFSSRNLNQHLNYWRKKLERLPNVFHTKSELFGAMSTYQCLLADVNEKMVVDYAAENHVTPFLVLLTTFILLLGFYAKKEEMIISLVEADRFPPITKNIIGYFSNHIFLRLKFKSKQSFSSVLQHLKKEYMESYEHHAIPFGKMPVTSYDQTLVAHDEELATKHGKILFNFIKIPDELRHPLTEKSTFLHSGNLPVESWESEQYNSASSPENFRHLFMRIISENSQLFASLTYAIRLFNNEEAHDFVDKYQRCINLAIRNPELKISELLARAVTNYAN